MINKLYLAILRVFGLYDIVEFSGFDIRLTGIMHQKLNIYDLLLMHKGKRIAFLYETSENHLPLLGSNRLRQRYIVKTNQPAYKIYDDLISFQVLMNFERRPVPSEESPYYMADLPDYERRWIGIEIYQV